MPEWKDEIRKRLASLKLAPTREAEIVEELAQHLQDRYAELISDGESEKHARLAALAELSDKQLLERGLRRVERSANQPPIVLGAKRTRLLNDLWQDLRYGLRMLHKSPGFAAAAVLSLALGIGANTAIFTAIDGLILRKLPVRNPEQLVTFSRMFPNGKSSNFVYAYFEGFQSLNEVFSGAYAVCRQDRYNVTTTDGDAAQADDGGPVRVSLVTGNYFSELGVNARAGRTFTADDDTVPGGHPVAVISYGYWQQKFGLAHDVVGRSLTLNNVTYTIIGVTQRGFSGEWVGRPTDFWIPLAMLYQVMPELPPGQRGGGDGLRVGMNFRIIARLKPGVTTSQAQAAGQVVFQRLMSEAAGPNPSPQQQQQIAQARLEIEPAAAGYSVQRESFARPLMILMMMVGMVLLVACANVANLLLARAAAREKELAVRIALGAGRGRIARQLLTESLLLATMGGGLGLLLAGWGTSALSSLLPSNSVVNAALAIDLDLHPDTRALFFTTVVCLLTGLLFGLAPAVRASRISFSAAVGGRGATSGERGFGLCKLLVISQVALSLVLLVGTGLFLRTLRNLYSVDLGFDREHTLLVWTNPGQTGRQTNEIASLWEKVQERVSALPGVVSASPAVNGLLTGSGGGPSVRVEGRTPDPAGNATPQREIIGPGFFDTVGQRLLLGRDFSARDTASTPPVVVINESLARYFFGDDNPVGQRLTDSEGRVSEIVGIVVDTKYNSPRDEQRMMYYYPYRQQIILHRLLRMCLAVRVAGNPASITAAMRQELRDIDPSLPVVKIDTIDEQLNDLLIQERLMAMLSIFFGALAALLACVGLYGVISYTVACRTNEIGIRMSLGATPAGVLRMIFGESLWLVSIGVLAGLAAVLAATRLISTMLFGVAATDPLTIAAAALLVAAVAALATLLPARRASRVDPLVALHCE